MRHKGFLLVMMQPPPTLEEEFNAWYDTEHVPERLSVPGFETALRFVCLDGHPRYLAMYDLSHPEVLDGPEYLKVAYDNSSPWTKRILQRVRVYRSAGRQIYPGDRITGAPARVEILRFRNRPATAAEPITTNLRRMYEGDRDVTSIRILDFDTGYGHDVIGFIERRQARTTALDLSVLGEHAGALDLVNTYAPYI